MKLSTFDTRLSHNVVQGKEWKICFFLWALYSVYIFVRWDAPVQDEIDFIGLSSQTNFIKAYLSESPFGYGQIYWSVLSILGMEGARIIALAAILSTPLLAIATSSVKFQTLLLWLSMPTAWWAGKLIGPELWAMALCAVALFSLHQNRAFLAGCASGIAVGLKLNSLPFVVFCLTLILLSKPDRVKDLTRYSLATLVGIVVSYPLIFAAKPTSVGETRFDVFAALSGLNNSRVEWDGVFSGGALTFSVAMLPLIILVLLSLRYTPKIGIAFTVSSVSFILMIAASRTQYGWYVFPMIPPMLYMFSQAVGHSGTVANAFGMLIVALNIGAQYPTIAFMIEQKHEQFSFLKNDDAASCLTHHLSKMPANTVLFNVVEFGYKIPLPDTFSLANSQTAQDADTVLVMHRFIDSDFMRSILTGKTLIASCNQAMLFSAHSRTTE